MESIVNFFRTYPEMAIFLTIGLGFWIGSLKYKNFTLGTVTSVLLVGVLVGQMVAHIADAAAGLHQVAGDGVVLVTGEDGSVETDHGDTSFSCH